MAWKWTGAELSGTRSRTPDAGRRRVYISSYKFYSAKVIFCVCVLVLCGGERSAISNTQLANPAPRPSYSHNRSHPPRLTRLT